MNKNLLIILFAIGILFQTNKANAQSCTNWAGYKPYTYYWDSCKKTSASLNAYIVFKNYTGKCFTYQWTVNGAKADSDNILNYQIKANGTYKICLTITDTCNKCDTTFCTSRSITCISSGSTSCIWSNYKPNTYYWDSCKKTSASLNAYIVFKSYPNKCLTYQWTVNGAKADSDNILNYQITANGKYNVCVKVTDTCNKCDTTYCVTRTITCISTSSATCNWSSYKPATGYYDSCKTTYATLLGYITFKNYTGKCLKYQWTVNGAKADSDYILTYKVTANGKYNVCVKVMDTCNKCDTTICTTRTITCITPPAASCNWASLKPTVNYYDSCKKTSATLLAYCVFKNYTGKCMTYMWTINGTKVDSDYILNYPITKNGTYNVCLKVTDTCNKCDTTFCSTRTITCITPPATSCNWASYKPRVSYFDSCGKTIVALKAYIVFSNYTGKCLTYQWTVNGVKADSSFFMNHKVTANGVYNICVKVTDTCNKCDTTICKSDTVKCVITAIEKSIKTTDVLRVYPNPAQDIVLLNWSANNSPYTITNMEGQKINSGVLNNGSQTLDLSKYPSGLYFIQVQTRDAIISQKIFLNKR